MNLCVDCKHHQTDRSGNHFCYHPQLVDPVTGKPAPQSCSIMRDSNSNVPSWIALCEEHGDLWAAKDSITGLARALRTASS